MERKPLVSVIMPAYNAAPFIEEAIASVTAQTLTDWELIIIDDCSADDSFAIAQAWQEKDSRITALRNDANSGVAKIRNRGIDMARGSYIAFLDSDDIWLPEKLERQLVAMTAADAQIGYCSYAIIDETGKPVRADYLVPPTARFEDILKENYIQCSAMLIRADIVKKIKFNPDYYHEDYVLGLDMLRAGYRAVGCREILLQWRYLAHSRSFDKRKGAVNRWRIYRRYLKLPLPRAAYLFACYTAAGLRKYLRRHEITTRSHGKT